MTVVVSEEKDEESRFLSYIKTILQRDITEISEIQSPGKLTRLLSLLATRTASIINLSDISSAANHLLQTSC